jgi:hypothetical protein
MMEPSEKSLKLANVGSGDEEGAVLGGFSAHSAMRGDHLNAVSLGQIPIQFTSEAFETSRKKSAMAICRQLPNVPQFCIATADTLSDGSSWNVAT